MLYGLCANAGDGKLRLVLELCDHGNVREYFKKLPHDKVWLTLCPGTRAVAAQLGMRGIGTR